MSCQYHVNHMRVLLHGIVASLWLSHSRLNLIIFRRDKWYTHNQSPNCQPLRVWATQVSTLPFLGETSDMHATNRLITYLLVLGLPKTELCSFQERKVIYTRPIAQLFVLELFETQPCLFQEGQVMYAHPIIQSLTSL